MGGGLSAHAGQSGLIEWIGGFGPAPRTVLVHGELRSQEALRLKLADKLQLQAEMPRRGESIAF